MKPRPGTRLRAFAARLCSERTMERLIDPVIGDLQVEYASAIGVRRRWLARLAGCVAFAKVFLWCGLVGSQHAWRNWDREDRQNLTRVLWRWGIHALAIAFLFEIPGLLPLPSMLRVSTDARTSLLIAYLVPSALATSLPIGMLIGTLVGLAGRTQSRRLPAAVLLAALVMSAAAFVNVGWIVPAANQSYREELIGGSVARGERELTLIELRRDAEVLRQLDLTHPNPDRVRRVSFTYHQRYALAAAPLTFALFGLVFTARRRPGRMATAALALLAFACVFFVLRLGVLLSQTDVVSPVLGAWLPHVVAVSAIAVVAVTGPSKGLPLNRTRV